MSIKEKLFLGFLISLTVLMTLFSTPEGKPVTRSTTLDTPTIVYREPNAVQRAARQMSRWSSLLFFTPGQKSLEWLFRGMEPITPGQNYQNPNENVEHWKRVTFLAMAVLSMPVAIPATLMGLATYCGFTSLAHRIHYVAPEKVVSEPTSQAGLTLMSYNTALTHSFVCALTHVRPPHERAHEIANKVLQVRPHVVVFQECLQDKDPLSKRLSQAGYHVFRDVALNPTGSESGLITASAFPVVHAEFFPIGDYIGVEALSNRGLFEVQLRLPSGAHVAVYNLHLQSGGDSEEVIEARSKQVATILKLVKERLYGHPQLVAAFVGGDWNVAQFGEDGQPTRQWENCPLNALEDYRNALYEARETGVLSKVDATGGKSPVSGDETPGTFWNLNPGHGWGTVQGDRGLEEQRGCNPDHFLVIAKKGHPIKLNQVELRHDFGDSSDHFPLTVNVDMEKQGL